MENKIKNIMDSVSKASMGTITPSTLLSNNIAYGSIEPACGSFLGFGIGSNSKPDFSSLEYESDLDNLMKEFDMGEEDNE